MSILRVKESFMLYSRTGGDNRMFRAGDLIDSSDVAVKGREMFFQPVEDFVEAQNNRGATRVKDREKQGKEVDAPTVERATAEPGEKRSVTVTAAEEKVSRRTPAKQSASEDKGKQDGEV